MVVFVDEVFRLCYGSEHEGTILRILRVAIMAIQVHSQLTSSPVVAKELRSGVISS